MPTDLKTLAEQLIAASERATAGPWNHEEERYSARNVIGVKPQDDRWVAHCQPGFNGNNNANFIALSRNTAPQLARALLAALDVVEALDGMDSAASGWAASLAFGDDMSAVFDAAHKLFREALDRFDAVVAKGGSDV